MPRSSDGSYSLPSGTLVNTGDTILVSQHNPFAQDVQQALSDSLDRNGTGGMLSDLNMNSNKLTNLAPGTNPSDAATVSQLDGGSTALPVGAIVDFAGATAPEGWLLCGGQSISRATYADLFAVIGTTYGSANGSSFNLPDLRGRVTAGRDFSNGGTADRLTDATMAPDGASLNASGGAETQALTEAQMPAHTHTLSGTAASAGAHTHTVATGTSDSIFEGSGASAVIRKGTATDTTSSAGSHTHTLSGTAVSTGGGDAHPNVQPTIILNKIIKVQN